MDKDGNTKELDSLGAAEKQHIIGLLCKLVGEEMSEYYNINKEQWKIFSAEASA